jgi:hypothetical protein
MCYSYLCDTLFSYQKNKLVQYLTTRIFEVHVKNLNPHSCNLGNDLGYLTS